MKSLWDYVASVQPKKATSLRFGPHHPVEYCIGREWTPHPWESRQDLVTPYLTGEQRRKLDSEKTLSGVLNAAAYNLSYQIFQTDAGLSGTIHWLNDDVKVEEWDLPPFYLEKIQKQSGLSLIYGPPNSGKSTLLTLLAQSFGKSSRRALYFSDNPEFHLKGIPCLKSSHLLTIQNPGLSGEILVVDTANTEAQRKAFDLAIEGATVLTAIPAASIRAAFYLWFERMNLEPSKMWPLVAENFISAMGLRLAPGLGSTYQPVFELLLNTSETKSLLAAGTVQGLVEVMAKGGDKSGMRTMNQALLQLLLKRKIELRVGFEESPDPVELDGLLKKVGI